MPIDPTAAPDAEYAKYPSLVDRTVFVTGGGDGIGAGIVEEFVQQGAKVGFADRNAEAAAATLERCAAHDLRHMPIFYEVDLLDIPATQAVMAQALEDLGVTIPNRFQNLHIVFTQFRRDPNPCWCL